MTYKELLAAATNGDHTAVERLLTVLTPQDIELSGALRAASTNGHTQCVQLLCSNDLPVSDTAALWWACTNGHLECVQILITRFNPNIDDSYALYCAVRVGHPQVVDFLIPLCDPKAAQSRALARAAFGGKTQCVASLIPVSDPKANNSQALRKALLNDHMECVEILYPVSDPHTVLQDLQELIEPSQQDCKFYQAHIVLKSIMEKEQLEQAIASNTAKSSIPRKI